MPRLILLQNANSSQTHTEKFGAVHTVMRMIIAPNLGVTEQIMTRYCMNFSTHRQTVRYVPTNASAYLHGRVTKFVTTEAKVLYTMVVNTELTVSIVDRALRTEHLL